MLHNVPHLKEFDTGNGVCRYLKNDLCSIYEKRPLVCNVQKMYDLYFCKLHECKLHLCKEMDERAYIQENLKCCLKLAEGNPEIKAKLELIYRQWV